ncbi:hypothetical protein AcW1_001905 [Taiwanofungus camphoratus]|nr:hypothetical protein AcV7_001753 [Antrodia cinnamomea]KAI0945758.1 hypothetical protein AcW1_001905 [Antrodia cinnamomea]
MPSIPSRPESVTKTVNDTDDSEAATASIQSLRAELSSFKFSGSPPMGLRRSPRNTFKYDANDDVLPTFSTDPAVPQSSHESSARRSMRRPKQKTSAMKSDMGRASGSTDVTALTPPHKRASPQAGKAEVIGRKISAASGQQKLKMKALKVKRGFAPPQMYAHLQPLHDYLQEELDGLSDYCLLRRSLNHVHLVQCYSAGSREKSAQIGHHFANPTNHFWRCLAGSELTDRLLSPTEDFTLPGKHNLGLRGPVNRTRPVGVLRGCPGALVQTRPFPATHCLFRRKGHLGGVCSGCAFSGRCTHSIQEGD